MKKITLLVLLFAYSAFSFSQTPCGTISPLDCDQVEVSLPVNLNFNGSGGGILSTGFTMVDPPSSRLASDDAGADPDIPGLLSGNLSVLGNALNVTATKGINFRQPVGTLTSGNTNSQMNALGVGFVVSSNSFDIEATLSQPSFDTSTPENRAQQAGIWLGLNENNFVKLVAVNRNGTNQSFQLALEQSVGALPGSNQNLTIEELNTANTISASGSTISLRLSIDIATNSVTGFYSLDGATEVQVIGATNALTIPASFLAGVDHDNSAITQALTYAGIMTTTRNSTGGSLEIAYDSFSVIEDVPVPPATVSAPYRMNVAGSNYTKDGDLYVAEDVDYLVERDGPTTTSGTSYSPNPGDNDLYFPRRYDNDFGYAFPIANGNYQVALHMVENFHDGEGLRVFDILAEGAVVVNDLDLVAASGKGVLRIETLDVTVIDGELNIDFDASINNGIVQAIEILAGNTAPVISSPATASVEENQTAAIDVDATDDNDIEGPGLNYALTGIIDDALFSIDAVTGVVSFISAPDFENQLDNGADNVYDIQVTVTDSGSLATVQDIAITVTDVIETVPFAAFINFQNNPTSTTPPAGYLPDYGKAFGTASVTINGTPYPFGWKLLADDSPIDVSDEAPSNSTGVGRMRLGSITAYDNAGIPEKLTGTLVHFQGDNIAGWGNGQPRKNELYWELEMPNGIYEVTLGLGDKSPGNVDSRHTATLEGYTIIPAFTPNDTETRVASMIVEVTDGALTMNGLGGFNSKITHVEVVGSTGTPVTGTLAFDPNTASPTLEAGATGSFVSTLSGEGATGIALNLEDDPVNTTADNFNEWLSLPPTDVPGEFTFGIDASALAVAETRNNRIIATAAGFTPAILNADLTVTEAPLAPFAFHDDFDAYGTGNLHEIAPAVWLKEKTTDVAIPVLNTGLTPNTTHALDFSNGSHAHDWIPLTDAPVTLQADQTFYFATYYKVTSVGSRIRVAIRIDDDAPGDQWARQQVASDGSGGLIARIGLGGPGSDNGNLGVDSDEVFQFVVRGVWDGANTITYSWTTQPKLNAEETNWTAVGTHTVQGTPQIGRLFISSVGVNDALVGPIRLSDDYTAVVTEEINNAPIATAQSFSLAEDVVIGTSVGSVVATDSDTENLTYAITAGNDAAAFTIDSATGEIITATALDFETTTQYELTVEISDVTTIVPVAITITVTDILETVACTDISTLACDELEATLPLALNFTTANGNLSESGMTMVLAPSARLATDDPVFNAEVPGYEPSLISQDGNGLTITSTKGIFFSQLKNQVPDRTPNSNNTNSQINALGVGVTAPASTFSVSASLLVPDFSTSIGNSAQQAGLWYGLDENRYIKLVLSKINATTQRVQLQVENLTDNPGSIVEVNLDGLTLSPGDDLTLRMAIDPQTNTVQGYYAVNGAAEVLVTNGTSDEIAVPAFYFDGIGYSEASPTELLSFAGIFTTHRNAGADQSIDFLFKNFGIEEETVPLSEENDILTFSLAEEIATATVDATNHTVAIEVNAGTVLNGLIPTITVSEVATISPDSAVPQDFNSPVTYTVTAENGVVQEWVVTVTAQSTAYAANINFQSQEVAPPAGYLVDYGKQFGNASVSVGATAYQYGWKLATDGTPIDASNEAAGNGTGVGRNRLGDGYASATDQEKLEGSLVHFQGDNIISNTGGTQSWAGTPRGNELIWELEVPNGTYDVTVGLGDKDAGNLDSRHSATIEGYTIIPAFIPTPGQTVVETMTVTVSDNLLTVTGLGGFNSKITHIEIVASTGTPVAGTLTFDPSDIDETLEAGAIGVFSSTLSGADATTIGLVINDNINTVSKIITGSNDWLTLPTTAVTGPFEFAMDATTLVATDVRTNTIIATAKGFVPAQLDAELVIGTPSTPCGPFSALPCDQIVVDAPLNLNFDGAEGGLKNTGFTMVDPYSAATRADDDGVPSNTEVPGYEPDNIAVVGGNLVLTANQGIAYLDNNAQINTLGVGVQDITTPLTLETTLLNIVTSDGSAQAGLWFGIDDENFVKLNVNNNNIEMRREIGGLSANGGASPDQIQVNAGASGEDVTLRLVIDPEANTLTAFYSFDAANFTQLVKTNFNSLALPAVYLTGKQLDAETGSASFAGVYATYRNNANSFDATFANFSVTKEEVPLAFNYDVNDLSFFGTVGTPVASKTVTLSASSGTPTFVFGDEAESSSWLILPANPVLGELEFGIVEGLTEGNYNTTIFAIDDSGLGYATAELEINLSISEVGTPQILAVSPVNGSTGVSVNASISANDIFVPNLDANGNAGIDNSSITAATVQLFKESVGTTPIAAGVNGTGGGDAISLVPSLPLESNTTYVFVIDGVLDTTGVPFEVFTSTFTTGGGGGGPTTDLDNVSFTNAGAVASGAKYSTLTKGPDGKLYGLEIDGDVHRWTINADGTLANEEVLNDWKSAYGSRAAIGFAFDPDATAGNLIAYLTHQSGALNNAPSWDGKISRITGVNLENEDLVVTNLPRSKKDHLTNSIAFRPTEPNVLYFNQGSNSAAGAPDNSWGNRKERLLSAASLRLDLDKLPEGQWPLDAKTTMDPTAINSVNTNSPTLASTVSTFTEDGQTFSDDGTYNPFYVNAPLTLYATGVRNAYDLVWHTNGQLYIPTNGTAGGSNAPASISGTRRPDGMVYDHSNALYPPVPASNNNDTQRDWLFRINPNASLGYYGHPNPLRGEFVLNRGDADVNRAGNTYDGVQADVNYRGAAFDFEFNKSPNGVIEYRSTAENGNLRGALLVVRYSGGSDIIALVPDGPSGDVTTFKEGIPGFGGFGSPLDLIEDVATGNIYVSDYGRSEIVLLKPQNQSTPMPLIVVSSEDFAGDAVTSGNASYSEEITLSNLGNATLENITAQITGADSDQFSISVLPGSVASQNSSSFTVSFDPSSNGPKFAQLTLTGTDAEPVVINLSGLGKQGLGGSNEPSLQWILDTQLGNGAVDVGDEDASSNVFDLGGLTVGSDAYKAALTEMLGDEVSIQSFERAIDAPITMELLSVYGPTGSNPVVALGWYETGNAASTNELFTVTNSPTSNGQRLSPPLIGQDEFDPGAQSFGFYSRWPAFQNRLLFSEDALNTFSGAIPHHVRVYELPGEDNAYIIATEEHISGFDYQDIVIIARNIRPAGNDPVVACSPISTLDCDEVEVALPFSLAFNGTEGGLSNTGFTMVDNPSARIAADGPISNANVPGYEPGQLSISNDNLIITANNGISFVTNGTGPGLSSDVNSQINTLGVGFDADAYGNFSITTTIVNPYTDGNNDSEQAGVWFGLNEDNFVKLIADGNGRVELRSELNAISVTANQVIATIPNLNTSTVQLRMFVDIDNAFIVPHYTLNGGVEVALDPLPLPSEYLAGNTAYDNQSFAGIFASKRRELIADVVYTFEDFAITPENNPVAFEPVNINFSRIADPAPAGYLVDSGLGFDDRGNDYSYGWLTTDGQTSLDLSSNTRNREVAGVDILQNTLNHMQYGDTGGNNGIATEGIWEIAVPNGTYIVSVAVGDPSVDNTDTQYSINVEGTNIIDKFEATGAEGAATLFTSASTSVLVLDGRLTIDAIGGFNTKINSLTIRGGGEITQPFFANVSPDDGATNVGVTGFQINVDVNTPSGYELDKTTLAGNVNLFKITSAGEELVPSNSNDTGGGDAITLTPLTNLDTFTDYVFRLSSDIEANLIGDLGDRIPFTAFESSFTTGNQDTTIDLDLTGVTFTKVEGGAALGESTFGERFSSLVIGPDGKLYASTIGNFNADGQIFRWDMAADGTLINLQKLSPNLQGNPHPETGVPSNNDRLIIGFTFDPASTADNLIAYITHSSASVTNGPEWDGVLTRLSGPNLEEVQDLIIHLPRSAKDHLTNSVITGPDGDLYITQGSNSAGGAPDTNWAFRPERLLAAAVLKVELDKLPASQSLPLSAFTTDNISVINSAPIGSIQMSDGTYNPYATTSPLTIFATGVRNAYDLVWHSNGWLYVPTNGTAGNQSDNPNQSSPNSPSTADFELARRIDGLTSIPDVPALFGGGTQKDWLFKTKGASYHGHPNPYRGEFVLNHGGITYSGVPGQEDATYKDVAKYASSVLPDPNYRQPAYDFDFNKSPNGAIEYMSNAFGGKLQGLLMVVRFSGQDDLLVMQPAASGDIANVNGDVPGLGGFDDPLDVVEDPRTGNIYVSEYDRAGNQNLRITLLRADVQAITGPEITALPDELIFETTVGTQGPQSETKTVSVVNEGTGVLMIQGASITGAFADQFNAVSPSGTVTLNPSESQEYTVTYAPELTNTNLGYQEASLTILSDDAVNPTFEIGLHALKKAGGAGGNEPALQNVVNALGIGIDVGWSGLTNGTSSVLQGDEVDVSLWVKASDAPINVTPVGRYSPAEELPYGWYSAGDASATNQIAVLSGEGSQAQSLFPEIASGDTFFDPLGAVFGFYVESNTFGRLSYTEDALNTGVPHATRVYPMKERDGTPIANSYLITFEDANNGDYQDYMFIIDNVIPFEDGTLVLNFNAADLEFVASIGQDDIPAQQLSISANGGVTASEIELTASEPWVVVPETYEVNSPFDIGIDIAGLARGTYSATISASATFYQAAVATVNLTITNELVYTYQFNFQDPDDVEPSPAGYVDDLGAPYGQRSTILGNLTYGWVAPGTLTPVDAAVNARNRNSGVQDGVLLQTFTIMGHPTPASFPLYDWVVDVPNGSYSVNISVGERDFVNSSHILDVNGIEVINFTQGSIDDGPYYGSDTRVVEVTDGTLRLSLGTGGANAKPNYIRLAPVNTALFPPVLVASFDGNLSAPDTYRGSVDVTLEATDNSESGGIASITYILDDAPVATYENPITIAGTGDHILVVTVEDFNGNITEETFELTIETPTGALLTLENMTKVPGTDRGFPADDYYTFYRLGNPGQALAYDANVMRLNNSGTADLIITEANVSDVNDYSYEVLDATGQTTVLPITIAPNSFAELDITFIGSTGNGNNGIFVESIEIVSNADNALENEAVLHGGYAPQPEGGDEINAQEVFDAFGFQTSMLSIVNDNGTITPANGTPFRPSSNYPDADNINAGYEGDLVLSEFFEQADPNQPVIGIQLSALHGGPGSNNARLIATDGSTAGGMNFGHNSFWYQTLLPKDDVNDGVNADIANTISTPFRISIGGQTTSLRTSTTGQALLGVRVFKVIDQDGNVVPNEYIALQDFIANGCGAGSANCDWNDNTFYFINIRPVGTPSAQPFEDVVVIVEEEFSFDIAQNFERGYPGNSLTISAQVDGEGLPSWMRLNPVTGVLEGTPPLGTSGSFNIEFTATDTNGLTASTTLLIGINAAPVAVDDEVFTIQNVAITLDQLLVNDSEPNGEEINITTVDTPENGSTQLNETENTILYTPNTNFVGTDTFEYTIEDESGLTATAIVTVIVNEENQAPIAQILADVTAGQAALQVIFDGSGSIDDGDDIVQYQWNFGDGTSVNTTDPTTTHVFTMAGQFTTSLTVFDSEGLFSTAAVEISVSSPPNTAPVAVATGERLNANSLQYSFDGSGSMDLEGALTYAWDFGDNSPISNAVSPTYTYAEDGLYTVTLTVTDDGSLADSVSIVVDTRDLIAGDFALRINAGGPATSFGGNTYVADLNFAGGKAFTNSSATVPVLYQSERSASPPAFAYNIPLADGEYRITLHFAEIWWGATAGGTLGTDQRIFDVAIEGTTVLDDFNINAVAGPETPITRTFNITVEDGILNLAFDANGPDGVNEPKLSAIEIVDLIVPNTDPTAVATATPLSGTAPLEVIFNGSGSTDTESDLTYAWDFGNGATSTEENPIYVYDTAGSFDATLTVTDAGGLSDSATVTIVVEEPVVGDFALRINAGGPATTFEGNAFVADVNFVGGKTFTNASATVPALYQTERSASPPAFEYAIPLADGQYSVTLHFAEIFWGATGGGTLGTAQRVFDVAIEGATVLDDFDINAVSGPQTPITRTFNVTMVDGTLNIAFDANGPDGVNQPKLSAIEIIGQTENLAPTAVATATPLSGTAPLEVVFNGSGSTDTESDLTYAWDFGNGATSTEENPVYVYDTAGSFDATLTVTDAGDLSDSATVTIVVDAPNLAPTAVATATPLSGTAPLEVRFEGSESIDMESDLTYAWDFGNGATSTEENPIYVYDTAGSFDATLTVTDAGGLSDSATVTIVVEEPVVGDFALRINAGGPATTFEGNAFVADLNFVSGNVFENPLAGVPELYQTERSATPLAFAYEIPLADGEYSVTLHFAEIYWGAAGGSTGGPGQRVFDVSIEGATVLNDFDINVVAGPEQPITRTFNVTVEDGILNLDFDALGSDGVDQPKLSAIEIIGQTENLAPTAVATATPLSGTAPLEVVFNGSGSTDTESDLTYAWDFGNGATSTEENPIYVYDTAGSFDATLTVTDAGGLSDSATVTIAVEEPVVGDFALRINAGGPATTFGGNAYVADVNFVDGKAYTNANATVPVLYQTERSALPPAFEYAIPLADGQYSVTLHFAEIFWGATGGGTLGTAQRVFDVSIEGATVLNDFDINAVAGPQTPITRTFNVTMVDGTLNLAFDALGGDGVDQPKLSAIEIIGQPANLAPTAVATATPLSGTAPLEVIFNGSGSTDTESDLTYAWDFGNGATSTEENPVYVYDTAGSFDATLTVTDAGDLSDSATVTIVVEEPVVGDFALRINAGGPATTFGGNAFVADLNFVSGNIFENPLAGVPELYQTERSATPRAFAYEIPLADGEYSVTLHFAEIWWGAAGGSTGGAGQRVFDVAIEGATVLNDFDINVVAGTEQPITRTFNVTVEDGILNLDFDALGSDGVDQPKLSAIEILGQTANLEPTAVAMATLLSGTAPLEVGFNSDGSIDPEGDLDYLWDFGNGTTSIVANPVYVYTTTGSFDVTLTVTDAGGLSDTDELTINVENSTIVEAPADLIEATYLQGSSNPSPTGPILRVEQGNRETYMKFDLSAFSGSITKAQLIMQVASDPGNGTMEVFLGSNSNWTETGLNGSNKPVAVGSAIGSISGTHSLGQVKIWELNVGQIPNGGLVTLIVKHSNGNDVAFASDETSQAPQLIITAEGGPSGLFAAKKLTIAPNPSSVEASIHFDSPTTVGTIWIFDSIGRLVQTMEGGVIDSFGRPLNVRELATGIYYLRTQDLEGNDYFEKIVVGN